MVMEISSCCGFKTEEGCVGGCFQLAQVGSPDPRGSEDTDCLEKRKVMGRKVGVEEKGAKRNEAIYRKTQAWGDAE